MKEARVSCSSLTENQISHFSNSKFVAFRVRYGIMNDQNPNHAPENLDARLEKVQFVTNETPHCLWDFDIRESNRTFLNGIDPLYFKHIADTQSELLESDSKQYAALALRSAYTQGLETLFALIGSAIQAPECTVGWMLRYQNHELEKVVEKIQNAEPLLSRFNAEVLTWEALSYLLHPFEVQDSKENTRICNFFARYWKRFATDFLNIEQKDEYNSSKHGLRLTMGGFKFFMSPEITQEAPLNRDEMFCITQSDFGSMFYSDEKLTDRRNFRILLHSVNWNPNKFSIGLYVIYYSVSNVVNFLKSLNGSGKFGIVYLNAESEVRFENLWDSYGSANSLNFNKTLDPNWITPASEVEIRKTYKFLEQGGS
jgi:hypothetical protein